MYIQKVFKFEFPSPIGEVVSYIVEIYVRDRKTGIEFPSPIGEVVSYIHGCQVGNGGSRAKVSVPYRGSSFLYGTRKSWRYGLQSPFPSPIGEVVSYIVFILPLKYNQQTFPSPIGEVVSYMMPLLLWKQHRRGFRPLSGK